ncbi:FecCD family ABC transporter permease [Thermococcus gorgonarius]|uniref:Iron ABC transporter n=1 Tax=Thermococcus gorgonarius TaxID=71997 RepID=A0A2Z2M6T8_THEGO|nr:iron ABC transporter permease [Thermococcus gorgonarius]ASJ00045.1 iron ABC transporter [Thermococcus gorgonarius]
MRDSKVVFTGLAVLSLLSLFLSLYIGPVRISPLEVSKCLLYGLKSSLGLGGELKPKYFFIVWELRLPRTLLAYLVGMSLASAGVASQALFKNPMADPYIIGISGGASIGAVLGFIYAPSHISELAFLFALGSVYLVYRVSRVDGRVPVDTLLLAGIAFGFMAGAITSYLVLTLGSTAHLTYMWLMGSFNGSDWSKVQEMAVVTAFGLGFLLWKWRELNLLLLGEEGIALGLEVDKFRKLLIIVISLMTAVAVATAGIIGFVGLIGPHIARLLVGPNHKRLTLNAAVFGGFLMVSSDIIARTVVKPDEIPVGIVTSIIGGGFFLYLLIKHKRGELRA